MGVLGETTRRMTMWRTHLSAMRGIMLREIDALQELTAFVEASLVTHTFPTPHSYCSVTSRYMPMSRSPFPMDKQQTAPLAKNVGK